MRLVLRMINAWKDVVDSSTDVVGSYDEVHWLSDSALKIELSRCEKTKIRGTKLLEKMIRKDWNRSVSTVNADLWETPWSRLSETTSGGQTEEPESNRHKITCERQPEWTLHSLDSREGTEKITGNLFQWEIGTGERCGDTRWEIRAE